MSLKKIKPTTEVVKIITEMDTMTARGRLKFQGALGRERSRTDWQKDWRPKNLFGNINIRECIAAISEVG